MSKRIVLFNHKGGVSKTTTTYNLGWKLAENSRVLLVDADPQCNVTSLLLGDDFDKYYTEEETCRHNLRDGVEVAFKGKPAPITAIDCFVPSRQPNLFLIPGHPNLSEFETALTFAQTSSNAIASLENIPGAFSALFEKVEEKYNIEYTIIDLNSSMSSINQNMTILSNYLIIPTNFDLFSLMAIDTLCTVLLRWAAWLKQSAYLFANSSYPIEKSPPVLLGTIIQRLKVFRGKTSRTDQENIVKIKKKTTSALLPRLMQSGMAKTLEEYGQELVDNGLCLIEIPEFRSLISKSVTIGIPAYALTDDEIGGTGSVLEVMQNNRALFGELFNQLATEVRRLTA